MLVKDVIAYLETIAPLSFQESYDNAGLQTGSPDQTVNAALLCVDITESVLDEAILKKANLIISHHPLIFKGIQKLTGSNYTERLLIRAIQSDLAIYSAHTNLDAVYKGVSDKMAEKLELTGTRILSPMEGQLRKLVFFVPIDQASKVRQSIFEAGAGDIGEYDMCSFNAPGEGTFRGSGASDPYVGKRGELHTEPELRVETIYPRFREDRIVRALFQSHPYEEVAYDIYPLANTYDRAGMGVIGKLPAAIPEMDFLYLLKERFHLSIIRHTNLLDRTVEIIAVCGGSGSFLLDRAIFAGAHVFVSGDFKYHQFFDADNRILLADIGHYESEQFTKEIFYESLNKKFPNFALHLSEQNTNPVKYY